jgi:asparagine synthase (glutamine-hydrolysing)
MCGVAGAVGQFNIGLISHMNRLQKHRGPDGEGIFEDVKAEVGIGHVRLSILDLSPASAQPMHSHCGRYVLSYNGEIYNFRELRDTIACPATPWRSQGDTEVLLHGLATEGASFLAKLNGMYAFALWDRQEQELMLARDPLGIKPLYYSEPRAGVLVFASEIKAICAFPGLHREANLDVLLEHLTFGHATSERTALKGVYRLLPGHTLRWKRGRPALQIERFWDASRPRRFASARFEDGVERLRVLAAAGVSAQLVADVPVGTFLSGGLDSSLITRLAAEQQPQLSCYTCVLNAKENRLDDMQDDAPYARELAKSLKLPLHEVPLTAEDVRNLPRLLWHMDEPIADPAILNCYLISRLAREQGTPVLLSGQGADELFGGYPRYRAMQIAARFRRLPKAARIAIRAIAELLPGAKTGKSGALTRRIRRVLKEVDSEPAQQFLNLCASTGYAESSSVWSQESRDQLGNMNPFGHCLSLLNSKKSNLIDNCLMRDLTVYLPNHNLLYTDKMGMAASIESRVPLLDQELVDTALGMPASWKIRGAELKSILKKVAEPLLPRSIIYRKKAGFGSPYRQWLRSELSEMWNDVMSEASIRNRGWFDPVALESARNQSNRGVKDLYMLQWATLVAELWAREFIDRNPAFNLA